MSYYFENNSRYQIIYPYTSDKIYVEPDIDHGAYRCYQELKERDVKTYIFFVHDIDHGTIYYFNIPKYKDLNNNSKYEDFNNNPVENITFVNDTNSMPLQGITNNQNPIPIGIIDKQNQLNTTNATNTTINPVSNPTPNVSTTILVNHVPPEQNDKQIVQSTFDRAKQNEIITRLNHVEYQLDAIKKAVFTKPPKKEEEGCTIM